MEGDKSSGVCANQGHAIVLAMVSPDCPACHCVSLMRVMVRLDVVTGIKTN
jgi:hypothetical protein